MPTAGDRFDMPDGSVYEVTRGPSETSGAFVEVEFTLPPGSVAPPPHVHQELVEEYEVIEGRFDVMVDGGWTTLGPGETASVPAGALHTFKNRADAVIRVLNVHRPPARFDQYIQHIHRLSRARGIRGARDPRLPIYLSMLMLEYPETLMPGRTRERVVLKALAGLGRLLRYRTTV